MLDGIICRLDLWPTLSKSWSNVEGNTLKVFGVCRPFQAA